MAVRLGGPDEDDLAEASEINVTPFIDVMLVLLIIFMVAAPLATVDAPVDLPRSNAKAAPRSDKPLFLTLKADLSVLLGATPVAADGLAAALDAATRGNREERLYLRADRRVPYGELMTLMNRLRTAGYARIALVGVEGGS
ncbi:TonB system transport protein ExbD [Prosthecomicrobium pneumaticum]|uniref:Biopolymer transport protein ExbD n=1 Tax=Prosthecomicrobium pneumaticum TaxID=81895 RepID=A0A7W9FL01_9HYPH|nr:TonB system transport protein ExbD [Prosthecomicrobium pneumaticum]MBB5752008.1 biopolymer transport protein ExbD [Prosthecomicrobium pneumaticum]